MTDEQQLRSLARVIYVARIQEAWGAHWPARDRHWPADEKAWRAYPHNPAAEVDLALASAKAALRWFEEQQSSNLVASQAAR